MPWCWKDERFELYALRSESFQPLACSERIRSLDFDALARFVKHPDQHQAVLAYREFLRESRSL